MNYTNNMIELIKINTTKKGTRVVSARELHAFLLVGNDFTTWCKRMFEYGFVENVDYQLLKMGEPVNQLVANPKPKVDYVLTIDCAKEISMIQRTDKGKAARQYFIAMEKKATAPKSRLELARENVALIEEIEAKDLLLQQAQPKIVFFDTVTDSTDTIDIGQAAKVINLGIGRNTLFSILRNKNILMRDNSPYQRYITEGWFRTIEQKFNKPDDSVGINLKTIVYQKGLSGIVRVVKEHLKK